MWQKVLIFAGIYLVGAFITMILLQLTGWMTEKDLETHPKRVLGAFWFWWFFLVTSLVLELANGTFKLTRWMTKPRHSKSFFAKTEQ